MRAIEWFSGIGGAAAALAGRAEVVLAVDQDAEADAVYRAWWGHPTRRWNVAGLKPAQVPEAELWWMSPPCQPYTIRGRQRDLADPRSRAFVRLLELLDALAPPHVALENVPWFEGSEAHARLRELLSRHGYAVAEGTLCPSELGVPMQRRRFFLLASRTLPVGPPARGGVSRPLRAYVASPPPPDTEVAADVLERFGHALHRVDPRDEGAVAACFTGAYGHSPVYAGSYLAQGAAVRRFAPDEILALLGFPPHCALPDGLARRKRYKLVGNSVSVDCVRAVLQGLGR